MPPADPTAPIVERIEVLPDRRIHPLPACKHATHGIHAHGQAGFPAPVVKQVTAELVVICQGLTVVSAGNARADLRHLHQRIPETGAVGLLI